MLSGAVPVLAQSPAPITGRIYSFVEDASLIRRTVTDLAFEEDGTVWVAASDGLYRYDGYSWSRFSTENGLPSNFVRSVLVTHDHVLWVGTDKGAGTFAAGRFTLLGDEETLAGPSVRRMVEDLDGSIWFCSDTWPDATVHGGLTCLSHGQWRRYGEAEGLQPSHILDYFRDASGVRYAMSNGGVFRMVDGRWVRTLSGVRAVWSMTQGSDGDVMAVAANALITIQPDQWSRLPMPRDSGWRRLCTTRSGEFLAGGRDLHGVVIGKWNGEAFEAVSPHLEGSGRFLEVIREAPDGSIWCGGDGLLVRWERTDREWSQYSGLPVPRFVDPRGRVWFVGIGFPVVAEGEQFKRLEVLADDAQLDPEGNVWLWSKQELSRWREGEVERFTASRLGLAEVQGCTVDRAGQAWFWGRDASGAPVAAFHRGEAWHAIAVPGNPGDVITSGAPHAAAGIWLLVSSQSAQTTVVHLSDAGLESRHVAYGGARYGPPGLLADSSGLVWIYGYGGALSSATPLSGEWSRLPGMESNRLLSGLLVDDRPWFVVDGLAGGQSGYGAYRRASSWLESAAVTGFLGRTGDGDVVVGVQGALRIVRKGEIDDTSALTLPVPGEVRSVVANGPNLWLGLQSRLGQLSVWRHRADGVSPATKVVLSVNKVTSGSRLRPEVSGVERWRPRQAGGSFRFSWRVDAGRWSSFGPLPALGIETRDLQPGTHRLSIRAEDEGLDVDPTPAEVAFEVAPVPLQDRAWFQPAVIAALAVIGVLALVAAERARKYARVNVTLREAQDELQRAHDHLERRVEERTAQLRTQTDARHRAEAIVTERSRMGRELHDSLEQGLVGVGMQLEATGLHWNDPARAQRHLQDAQALLRMAQTEVRRAVNDLHAEALDNHDLGEALRRHVARIDADSPVRLSCREQGTRRALPTEVEHNVFRIAQEAIGNALKHSGGDHITITLDYGEDEVGLVVEDNGVGVRTSGHDEAPGHFGLMNMKSRARRLGGQLTVADTGAGTRVVMRCPLSPNGATMTTGV